MKHLLKAIIDRFTAASLPSTITGGLHHGIAPAGTAMPYAIYNVIGNPNTQVYGSRGFSEPEIQFTVRAVGDNAALLLAESVRDAYANQMLTLSSGQMLNTILAMDCVPEPDDPGEDQQRRDVWGWIVSFRYSYSG